MCIILNLVRYRKHLSILDGPKVPENIRFAAVYSAYGPTRAKMSMDRLLYQPISMSTPALIQFASSSCPEPCAHTVSGGNCCNISMIIRDLALIATPGLSCLSRILHSRRDTVPDPWMMTYAIFHHSGQLHFVAHVPYRSNGAGENRFLSLVFAVLPVPSPARTGDLKDIYRLINALLSLQQHTFRLTNILERASWTADEQDSSTAAAKAVLSQLVNFNVIHSHPTPTPSEYQCDWDDYQAEIQRYYDELRGASVEYSDVTTGPPCPIMEKGDLSAVWSSNESILSHEN